MFELSQRSFLTLEGSQVEVDKLEAKFQEVLNHIKI